MPVIHTEWDPPEDKGIDCSNLPSMTKQSFRDECDINVIMRRAVPVEPGATPPMYGDFSSAPDFFEAESIIANARLAFEALPSAVRGRFANDPVRMLEFLDNPKNLDEAVELGLCVKRPEAAVPPAAEPPAAEPVVPVA